MLGGSQCTGIRHMGIAGLLLLLYAISRNDPVFIVLQSYNLGATALIYYFCQKYKDNVCEKHGGEDFA